ncbi:MAG TPA: hypothetical protein VNF75_06530 [Candidatus Dormibacteraeota bacterium]|nr:hypothetical protein [Candidatus Dormibacteraeota bacterium]
MSDPEPRVNLERMRQVYEATRAETAEQPLITQRAVARIDRDLHMEGRVGTFRLESDEPVAGGGGGSAPRPLQYLLAGAAF